VGNYILMPDHVHLFARPEIGADRMVDCVEMWKSVSSRRIAAALSIKPPIWRPGYFDRYLRSSESNAENGITLSKTPCGQGSSRPSKRGRIVKRSTI
jgi:putative transposase